MAKNIEKNNLGYLGNDYQRELVKCFIEDNVFFSDIQEIVDPNMFTDECLRRIVGFMKERFSKTQSVTTYRDLDTIIRSKVSDGIMVEKLIAVLVELANAVEYRAIDIIKDEAEKFFKQQNITKVIRKAEDIIKQGDINRYYEIETMIRSALDTSTKQNYGYRMFSTMEQVENDLRDDYRIPIPTGASELDAVLNGGLAKRELGVIVAPSNVGKTSATTGFAACAALHGFKVVHIFFEDDEINIRRKHYAYLTNYDSCDLSLPHVKPLVLDMLSKMPNERKLLNENIISMRLNSGEVTASGIRHKIEQLIALGFKPDLVIIDYFECIKPEPTNKDVSEWNAEGDTMRKLENIAKDFDVGVWVPVQGNKSSFNQMIVDMSQAGGSVKKVQIGHVIISFARTYDMQKDDRINIFINKFRGGRIKENKLENVVFNNGTCRFDFSEMQQINEALGGKTIRDNQLQVANEIKNMQRNNRT